jgi:hypothetical protein
MFSPTLCHRSDKCCATSGCDSCAEGFYLAYQQSIYTCASCTESMPNCKSCDCDTVCNECKEGFFRVEGSKDKCVKCEIEECQVCASATTCLVCNAGFRVDTSGCCEQCTQPNCKYCFEDKDDCQGCIEPKKLKNDCTCADSCTAFEQGSSGCACHVGAFVDGVCENNLINHCLTYTTGTKPYRCSKCQPGFYLLTRSDEKICDPCTKTGFTIVGDLCHRCTVENCHQCTTAENTCSQCISGYFLNSNQCKPCGRDCLKCTSNTVCQLCRSGLYMKAGACTPCTSEGEVKDAISMICLDGTSTCDCLVYVQSKCVRCKEGMFLRPESSQCVDCVANNEYALDGKCYTCDTNCKICDSPSSCKACTDGYFLGSDQKCHECSCDCEACIDQKICLKCKSNYRLEDHGLRCMWKDDFIWNNQGCNQGFFATRSELLAQGQAVCERCTNDGMCMTCQSETTCTKCQANYLLFDFKKRCIPTQECDRTIKFYSDQADPAECKPCPEYCRACSKTAGCITCEAGYFLSETNNACVKCEGLMEIKWRQECRPVCDVIPHCSRYIFKSEFITICEACETNWYLRYEGNNYPFSSQCVQHNVATDYLENNKYVYQNSCCSCRKCVGHGQCGVCEPGFFIDGKGICSECFGGCTQCSLPNLCTRCPENKYLLTNSDNSISCDSCSTIGYVKTGFTDGYGSCLKCPIDCDACDSNLLCTACKSTHVLSDDRSACITRLLCASLSSSFLKSVNSVEFCMQCDRYCKVCASDSCCTTCYRNYYLGPDEKCYKCMTNCDECSWDNAKSMSICSKCLSGYFLDTKTKLCTLCDAPGDYKDEDLKQCISPCVEGCKVCLGRRKCKECTTGYTLEHTKHELFAGLCVKDCDRFCTANCLECESGASNKCTTCVESFYLTEAFTCAICLPGCKKCCEPNTCESCLGGFYLHENGRKCVPCNLPGQFKETVDGVDTCKNCLDGCDVCENASVCCNCIYPMFLQNPGSSSNICVFECGVSHFKDTVSMTCIKCEANLKCEVCKSLSECAKCLPGYYLNAQGGCNACGTNCDFCINEERCLDCSSKFYLTIDGCCDACTSPGNFIIPVANTCIYTCVTDCKVCETASTCKECVADKRVLGHDKRSCVNSCQTANFDDGVNSIVCDANCADCLSATKCLLCNTGYYASGDMKCYKCPPNCADCVYTGPTSFETKCTKCSTDYYLFNGGCSLCLTVGIVQIGSEFLF